MALVLTWPTLTSCFKRFNGGGEGYKSAQWKDLGRGGRWRRRHVLLHIRLDEMGSDFGAALLTKAVSLATIAIEWHRRRLPISVPAFWYVALTLKWNGSSLY